MMAGTATDKPLSTAPALALATRVKTFNEPLRQELDSYKQEMGITNGALSKQLGVSETAVVKYLGGKPEGDVARFEARADSLMRNQLIRQNSKATLTETNVTSAMIGHFQTTQKTNDVSLVVGPSGIGKSCGCAWHLHRNPIHILVQASVLQYSKQHVFAQVWKSAGPRSWKTKEGSQFSTLCKVLAGSDRQIIVDDAHRLTVSGLKAVFALHDATDCPVSLVAFEDDVEELVQQDGQLFSRIGLKTTLKLKSTTELATHLIAQFVPDSGEELLPLALQVIQEQGHGRALRKQLLLAREMKEAADGGRRRIDWVTAFRAAHTRLIRPYSLTT